jgi:polyphosphate kinase
VLTPLAVDPAHPFPYISGLSLNLAVIVRNPDSGKEHFARVKVPPIFSRWMPVAAARFVPLEDVIAAHLDSCSRAWRSSTPTPSASPATRTSRSRRTTQRTC